MFYEASDFRHKVRLLRKHTADGLMGKNFEMYIPYEKKEKCEYTIKVFFFINIGITNIALYFGCPEAVIMEKILSMDLYSRYDEFVQLLRQALIEDYSDCDDPYTPHSKHDKAVAAMRKATPMYFSSQFEWTEEMKSEACWLFEMGEDITDIALKLGCPEWMVLKVCLETQQLDT